MSLGTGSLKVSGEGPEVIQAPQGGLHGNRQAGTTPVAAANRHRHTETCPVEKY